MDSTTTTQADAKQHSEQHVRRRRPTRAPVVVPVGVVAAAEGVDQPATSRQRATLFGFAGFAAAAAAAAARQLDAPKLGVLLLPQWGRLIDDCGQGGPAPTGAAIDGPRPATRRCYHQHRAGTSRPFASPFNDA